MTQNPVPGALVTIATGGESFTCRPGMNVLEAMERSRCRAIPVGCRNGGCGACLIRVLSGRFETGPMNRAVVTDEDRTGGRVMACRTKPLDDLRIEVIGRHWKRVAQQSTEPSASTVPAASI